MTYSEHTGNLFDSGAPVLAHGVNTVGVMGAGIAAQFAARFPGLLADYQKACTGKSVVPGLAYIWKSPDTWVLNLATQDQPGPHARLDWIVRSLLDGLAQLQQVGYKGRVAMPRIGCGIGGLDWANVQWVLESVSTVTGANLEVWTP